MYPEAIPSNRFWLNRLFDRGSMAVACEPPHATGPADAVTSHSVCSGYQAALEDMRGHQKPQRMALRPRDGVEGRGVEGRESNDQLIDVK